MKVGFQVSSGIYKLTFSDGSFYIGRSINILSRFKDHKATLTANKHRNYKVQNAFDRLGLPEVFILEECDSTLQVARELYWINLLNATVDGLNISKGGDDAFQGDSHPCAKYTNLQVLAAVKLLGSTTPVLSHKEICEITGIGEATIKDIICERSHLWVKEQHPVEFQQMLDTKILRKAHSISNLNPFANKKIKKYPPIQAPNGEIFYVEHLTNFAKEHGLQASNLSKVFTGKRLHHKGWKLYNKEE